MISNAMFGSVVCTPRRRIEKVPFPAKTLFIKDILSSPMLGHNMDSDTVTARRKGLSAWLRAVHRIRPEEQLVRNFFLTNQYRLPAVYGAVL